MIEIFGIFIFSLVLIGSLVLYLIIYARAEQSKFQDLKEEFLKKQRYLGDKLYETQVLSEISKRIGYSLNVERVIDIITSSLGDILEYSAVSSLIIKDDSTIFKTLLKESVGEKYITEVKKKVLSSYFSTQKGKSWINKERFEDIITGAVINSQINLLPRSYFNIPIFKQEKVVGVINVSSKKRGLYAKDSSVDSIFKIANQASEALSKISILLETENKKLSSILTSFTDGVAFLDDQLRILVTNPSFYSLLQFKEYKSLNILDIVSKVPNNLKLEDAIQEALKVNKISDLGEVYMPPKALKVFVIPVEYEHKVIGAALILQNITKEKELEKMREDFTSMMVHDLRAPLTVIRGTSDMLHQRMEQLEKTKIVEFLMQIKISSSSLLDIVNSLLDVAKMEAGKMSLDKIDANLSMVVENAVKPFESIAKQQNIYLKIKKSSVEIPVFIDTEKIGRVLINLVSNSLKYTNVGGVSVEIKRKSNSFAVVTVKDTGVGMTKDQQARLFNKFEQMRSPLDPSKKGTGLGLVIAKGLIEAHGGKIGVKSAPNKGTEFWFTLPTKSENLNS